MLVSLGHSCQTRFVLEGLEGVSRRMPFDFNITTRQALLAALETDGASLRHDADTARVFATASDGREGIAVNGFYLWHDYPLGEDKLRLAEGWQRETGRVNEKYAALWARFSDLLRADEPKTLALSNSQHNLGQFSESDEDFARHFGLGRAAFEDIAAALDAYGAKNWRLIFLSRSIGDLTETAGLNDPRLDHRFVGILSLRPDPRVAASLTAAAGADRMASLPGSYENGLWQVRAASPHAAIVHRRTEGSLIPHGSITLAEEGAVLWAEGRDRFEDIGLEPGRIRFADGSAWHRDDAS